MLLRDSSVENDPGGLFSFGGATPGQARRGLHLLLGVLVHGARVGEEVVHGGEGVVVVVALVAGDGGVVVDGAGVDVDVVGLGTHDGW